MNARFCGRSSVGLHRASRFERRIFVRGMITRERYKRLDDGSCGAMIESSTVNNTIVNIDRIINLITDSGVGRGAHFSPAYATLRVFQNADGSGSGRVFVGSDRQLSTTAQFPNGFRYRWEFWDNSTSTYVANYARLYNGDPDEPQGAEDETTPIHISETNPAFGSKPSDENWHYYYDIEIYSPDSDMTSSGHTRMMQCITGDSSAHFTTDNIRLQPKNASDANVGSPIAASGRSVGVDYFEFTFVSPEGSNIGTWATTEIEHNWPTIGGWTPVRSGGCRENGTSCGDKDSNESWTYTWRYTLSNPE